MAWSSVIMFVVSLVVQNVQARKIREAQRKAAEEADKQKGFQLVREGEAFPIPIIYGRQKVGGIKVYQNSFSNYKGADQIVNYQATMTNLNCRIFTSKNEAVLIPPATGKVRAYFVAPGGVNIKKIENTENINGQNSLPIIEDIPEEGWQGGNYDMSSNGFGSRDPGEPGIGNDRQNDAGISNSSTSNMG